MSLDFETDEMLVLLTEALRAGPGSPAWHEAIQRLKAAGADEQLDEYRQLVAARERLESGKEYRSVRAGPEFGQKLLSAVEKEAARVPRAVPSASTIALVCAGLMLVGLLAVSYFLWTGQAVEDEPAGPMLVNTVAAADLDALPADWRIIGSLPLDFSHGAMRIAGPAEAAGSGSDGAAGGGGIVWSRELAASEPFAVQAGLRIHRSGDSMAAQVFVTDDPEFSEETATSPRELVLHIQGGQWQVIAPPGRVERQGELPADARSPTLRLVVERDQASVDLNGRKLWSGPSGLDPGRGRHVGLRFIRRDDARGDAAMSFRWIKVNMRAR